MTTIPRTQNDDKVKEAYNQVSWYYDIWSRLTEQKAMDTGIRWACIRNGDQVLDAGCGTGRLLEQIIPLNPGGTNVGIELSPAMLRKARARLADQEGNHNLIEGDFLQWSGADKKFDLIFNYYVVDLMAEQRFDAVASGFYKMIRPGGQLVMATFNQGTTKTQQVWSWLAKNFPRLMIYCRPVDFSPYLEKAGFRIKKQVKVVQNTFPSEVILALRE